MGAGPGPDSGACDAAGAAAEQAGALPPRLLTSIGQVESGRWPWAVNVDGAGYKFSDAGQAASFVRQAQANGARDVDVGCFQISLRYHPEAFGTLEAAFDPVQNAGFAAKFLNELKARDGGWAQAVADYHSATAVYGAPYEGRVMAVWQDANYGVVLMGRAARGIRVITMDGETGPPMRGLPKVITP